MKTKMSITIDEEKLVTINEILQKGLFRNKSHILEYALIKFLEKEQKIGNFLTNSPKRGRVKGEQNDK